MDMSTIVTKTLPPLIHTMMPATGGVPSASGLLPILGEKLLSHCQTGCNRVLNSYRGLRGLKTGSSSSSTRGLNPGSNTSVAVAKEMMDYVQSRMRGHSSVTSTTGEEAGDASAQGLQDQESDADVAFSFNFPAHAYGAGSDKSSAEQNC